MRFLWKAYNFDGRPMMIVCMLLTSPMHPAGCAPFGQLPCILSRRLRSHQADPIWSSGVLSRS